MREGWDVIYQPFFFDGSWQGRADFLIRVDAPSGFTSRSERSRRAAREALSRDHGHRGRGPAAGHRRSPPGHDFLPVRRDAPAPESSHNGVSLFWPVSWESRNRGVTLP